jgi:hypothetical protein
MYYHSSHLFYISKCHNSSEIIVTLSVYEILTSSTIKRPLLQPCLCLITDCHFVSFPATNHNIIIAYVPPIDLTTFRSLPTQLTTVIIASPYFLCYTLYFEQRNLSLCFLLTSQEVCCHCAFS